MRVKDHILLSYLKTNSLIHFELLEKTLLHAVPFEILAVIIIIFFVCLFFFRMHNNLGLYGVTCYYTVR